MASKAGHRLLPAHLPDLSTALSLAIVLGHSDSLCLSQTCQDGCSHTSFLLVFPLIRILPFLPGSLPGWLLHSLQGSAQLCPSRESIPDHSAPVTFRRITCSFSFLFFFIKTGPCLIAFIICLLSHENVSFHEGKN